MSNLQAKASLKVFFTVTNLCVMWFSFAHPKWGTPKWQPECSVSTREFWVLCSPFFTDMLINQQNILFVVHLMLVPYPWNVLLWNVCVSTWHISLPVYILGFTLIYCSFIPGGSELQTLLLGWFVCYSSLVKAYTSVFGMQNLYLL